MFRMKCDKNAKSAGKMKSMQGIALTYCCACLGTCLTADGCIVGTLALHTLWNTPFLALVVERVVMFAWTLVFRDTFLAIPYSLVWACASRLACLEVAHEVWVFACSFAGASVFAHLVCGAIVAFLALFAIDFNAYVGHGTAALLACSLVDYEYFVQLQIGKILVFIRCKSNLPR